MLMPVATLPQIKLFEGRIFIWMFQLVFPLNIKSFETVVTLP